MPQQLEFPSSNLTKVKRKTKEIGKELSLEEKKDVFKVPEGSANLYYGRIRSGKSYGATVDIIDELKRGRVVYATWPIKVSDFDDRKDIFMLIRNTVFFWKKIFYWIPCSDNLHYIDVEAGCVDGKYEFDPKKPREYIDYLNRLNHCSIYIDEAWRVIDSYMPVKEVTVEARNLILVTGHKFRTVNLIAQRPTSISAYARGNINRFYKFVKIRTWPWIRFARYEFQDMVGENVDETADPISVKKYWAQKSIYEAYNSYYYGDLQRVHALNFRAFKLNSWQKFRAWINLFSTKKEEYLAEIEEEIIEEVKIEKPLQKPKRIVVKHI